MKKIISIMLSVLLIYGMIFYAAGTNEWVNKVFTIGALVSVCFMLFTKSFKEKLPKLIKEPIVVALFSYFAIYILSMFWAKVGKMAFDEITKLILSMSVFIITLIAVNKENMRFTLGFLSGVLGVLGLLNIDLAGPKILSYPFVQLVNKIVPGIEPYGTLANNRIWTAFGNPNIFAPVMVVGIFISAYLYMISDKKLGRLFSAIMLTFCQIAFIACYSLGNILFLSIALIVFILFMEKGCRLKSLFTMFFSFVISAGAVALIFTVLRKTTMLYLFDILMVVAGLINWFILSVVRIIFLKIGEKVKKIIAIVAISLATLAAVYIGLAINITGPFTGEKITVKRAFYPEPGEYQLKVDADKDIDISIYSQNLEQAQSYASKTVYKGKSNNTKIDEFIIDDDVEVAYIWITTNEANVNKVEFISSEGVVINIPLKYKFVPEFIVDRLQGLRDNQSMLQRFVFWQDGLKIFVKSPVLGNGIGAFETDVNSIRNINYETKYPHNVGVKVLVETGIVGALIFIGLIVAIYYTLLKRNSELKQLKATLLAIVTMLVGHSFMEVNMNYAIVISMLFIILAITVIVFNKEKEEYKPINLWLVRGSIIVFAVLFITMYVGNLQGNKYLLQKEKGADVFDKLNTYMLVDPFNKADYLLSYLGHAEAYAEMEKEKKSKASIIEEYENEAKETLDKLNKSYAYASCEYIEKYFIEAFDIDSTLKLSKLKLEKNRINGDVWRAEFQYFETLMSGAYIRAGDLEDRYVEIVNHIIESYENLKKINEEVFRDIRLHERNTNLVARALKAKELLKNNSVSDVIKLMDNFVYDSSIIVDDNNDGVNENVIVAKNNKSITFKAFIKASTVTKFRGEIEVENPADVTRVLIGGKPSELTVENNKVIFNISTVGEGNTEVKIEIKDATKFNRVTLNKELAITF